MKALLSRMHLILTTTQISAIICFTEEETDAERSSFWFKAIHSDSPGAGFESTHTWPKLRFSHSANGLLYQLDEEDVGDKGVGDLESRGDLGRSCPVRTCEHVGFLWNAMISPWVPETLSLNVTIKTLYVWCNRQCFGGSCWCSRVCAGIGWGWACSEMWEPAATLLLESQAGVKGYHSIPLYHLTHH